MPAGLPVGDGRTRSHNPNPALQHKDKGLEPVPVRPGRQREECAFAPISEASMKVDTSPRGRPAARFGLRRVIIRTVAAATIGLAFVAPSADAAIYDPGPLLFETFGQSMWDTGDAAVISNSAFLGASWNASLGQLGGIIGSANQRVPGTGGSLTAPNPLHAIWEKCNDSIFKKVCGNEPSRTIRVDNPIPAQFVDTRSGATLGGSTNGRVGLDLSYAIDSGSVNAGVSFDTRVQVPEEIVAGEYFFLNPSSALAEDQSLTTNFPEVSAKIDAVFQASASFSGQACATLFGCQTGSGGLSVDETFEIVSFNDPESSPGQIKILEVADPAAFQFGSKIELGGPTSNIGNVTIHTPDLNTEGALDADSGSVKASGESQFIDFRADLDGLASLALGLPTLLGTSVDVGPISVGYDIVDVEAGPNLKVVQEFELVPTLMVELQFNRMVDIDGVGLVDSYTGTWDSLPGIALSGDAQDVTITPTFYVDALLQNSTSFGVSGVFTLDALAGSASASVGGFSIDIASFGPLYQFSSETETLSLPPIYDNRFGLGGFNTHTAQALTIGVGGAALAGTLADDYAATLTTGSPVSISQFVDNPGNLFTLEFDYLFQTGGGWLDILLDGYSLLASPLFGPGSPQADYEHFSMTFNLADLGISLTDPDVLLEFLFNDDTAGSVLLVDNIVFPNLLNGDFQTGSASNWRSSETGSVGVQITDVAELTSVPEPASLLMLLVGLAGLAAWRSGRLQWALPRTA